MYNASLSSLLAIFAIANTAFSFPTTGDLLTPLLRTRATTVPRLLQYVQTFHPQNNANGHLSLLPIFNQKTRATHVILAALHINGPNGDITLNDNSPNSTYYDATWSEAATLQTNGIKVMVMMGGAAQGSYAGRLCNKSDSSVQDAYYLPLVSTLKYHKVDGIDLDIEESVPLACPVNLVTRIRQDFGPNFIITMAPVASDLTGKGGSALGGFSYSSFDASSAGPMLDWYNGQYYSGFVVGSLESSYQRAISNGYSPSRVVMGVLDSANDGSGFVKLSAVKNTIANLKSNFANFGGVDGWEYFDAGSNDGLKNPWQWTKQVGNALFGVAAKREVQKRERVESVPELPGSVAALMAKGHGQIAAARAVRLARGDEGKAEAILAEGL